MIGRAVERPRVLIVEDEQIVAVDLVETLLELGYEVLPLVDSGRRAIQLIEQQAPDLVLMDIHLKGKLDGIQAAEEIARRWKIPVVFVTANTDDEMLSRAKAAAPYGYLLKPFRSKEVNATIVVALHQQRLSEALFSEQAWLRTTLGSLSDGVIATDLENRIRYMNSVAEQLTGWTLSDASDRPFRDVFVITTLNGEPIEACQLERAVSTKRPVGKARFLLCAIDGRKIPIADSAAPIVERGELTGAVSVFLDITDQLRHESEFEVERDRLEEQVQATEQALGETRSELRALSAHLMTAQEDERRRVARELHDDFCQKTAVLEIDAQRAIAAILNGEKAAEQIVQQMQKQISQLGSGLRSASHRLHPSVLEDLGLIPALKSLVEDLRQNGSDIVLQTPEDYAGTDIDTATALYRIAQEALRNAMNHANGAPVRVRLAATEEQISLSIEDAGPGFNIIQARSKGGLGLLSMQERARHIGGTLFLKTAPGDGTFILVRAPVQAGRTDG